MAAENSILNAIVALRPLRDEVDNFFLFEEEVKTALTSIFEKNCVGQSSLKRAKMSQIPATALLEGRVKMWLDIENKNLPKTLILDKFISPFLGLAGIFCTLPIACDFHQQLSPLQPCELS